MDKNNSKPDRLFNLKEFKQLLGFFLSNKKI